EKGGRVERVRIRAGTAENSIVVYSNQEDYRIIERSLRELDRPRLQVAIEATVAEVTLTDALQFGVQYFFANRNSNVGLLPATGGAVAAPAATAPSPTATAAASSAVQTAIQSAFLQL